MKNKKLFWIVFTSVAIFTGVLTLDLLTKYFIFKLIPHYGQSMDVMPGFVNFVHIENLGAAWGIFAGRPIFLMIISIVVLSLFLTFYILKLRNLKNSISPLLAISVGLIAGGCIGNFVDRLFFGYVRDFINFQFMNFPVFNFADIAVTVSVVLLIVYFIFVYPKEIDSRKKVKNIDKKQEKNENFDEKIENEDQFSQKEEGEDKNER